MRRAVLLASGSYHPPNLVPNAVFDARFGTGVGDWLVENLTIRQRYWVAPEQATSDLCVQAATHALDAAGLEPEEIDLIIVATDTPDYLSPSTAAVVQHRLGARRAGTFDLNAACSAFVIGLDLGSKYIAADPRCERVLVLGGYAMSRHLDPDDKKTVTLFADGGGAVVLGASQADDGAGFLGSRLRTEGQYHDWMGIYAGGTRRPVDAAALEEGSHRLRFTRKFPKEINPTTWTSMIRELCGELEISPADVDHYVFTQLNIGSIHQTLDALEVPRTAAHTVMDRFAYTGSACIPMAYDDLVRSGGVQPGQLVFFVASGGGLSFATAAFRT
ncbi:MAG: ketoacyl-ACP synthase III [Myxococcales bacterium]|nr:ketoacyl-ACP synthase III [Myxococcales bacterium]